jgi:molybdopterin converting factor subunit 1
MIVTVHLFARARDLAGEGALSIELAQGASVGDLKRRLSEERPELKNIVQRSAMAVNDEFADDNVQLQPGAAIALLPPVSGGWKPV